MTSAWNWIGIIAWIVVLALFIWVFHNIRVRRIKMIVERKHTFEWGSLLITTVELVISFGLIIGMGYATFNRRVDLADQKAVKVSYQYEPLVLRVGTDGSYYVAVERGTNKKPVHIYHYWVNGARYTVSSNKATVVSNLNQVKIADAGVPWSQKALASQDKRHERAYVVKMTATYQPTFWNGLGVHVGHQAMTRWLIRVPEQSFINTADIQSN
ncbi:LVIS_2131 family protein [Lactiplantibacillus modestisalitolerans]|uniref:LVIS_2131 family protein n=1 Tax=Lactiplantibacillus modestisalitolerans TaxID=1457219 RepID=A0ABV5WW76_9LACO|nr:LVIS_2131 family protein [Lactiplantibacillus modestisalitolerans]